MASARLAATRAEAARPADLNMTAETVDSDDDNKYEAGLLSVEDKTAAKKPATEGKKKAASTYTRCANLLKFLILAQYQQHHQDVQTEEILNGTMILPTMDLEHR